MAITDRHPDEVEAGEPAFAPDIPVQPRKKMGLFAKISIIASIATIVMALAFFFWLQQAVQTDQPTGTSDNPSRLAVTVPATIPTGDVYVVLASTEETVTSRNLIVLASLTKDRLTRAGFTAQTQCLGPLVVVAMPSITDETRAREALGLLSTMDVAEVQSISESPPDTSGLKVGCS